jgi:macrodomain Ter protein organizer (MatP/YcbG family)
MEMLPNGKALLTDDVAHRRATLRASPAIERSVWEYFSGKAERKGINLSELLTDVLKRDTEINETSK